MSKNDPAERTVRDIRRKTRKQYTAEEKIRIVVSGLRGEESIPALCRREGIAEGLYYSWSKEFLEAGKKRLAGATPSLTFGPRLVVLDPLVRLHGLDENIGAEFAPTVRVHAVDKCRLPRRRFAF